VTDTVVIGAGLFGSIIAAKLRSQGREVLVVDDARPGAGSIPAACLMKPSWFSSLGKDVHEPALRCLDELYGVKDLTFKVGPVSTTVHWCDPRDILVGPDVKGRATGVATTAAGGLEVKVRLLEQEGVTTFARIPASTVVVAAGIWTPELVPVEGGLAGQAGMAFLWPDERIEQPFISPWAPYRQLVAFNRGDGLWVGDGTAIKAENWSSAREDASHHRCVTAIGSAGLAPYQRLYGIRPYSKEKPCYLREASPGLWVATGGAKNGTLAAGWAAQEIERATR
jgi:glycine/D-amino acid oxidase-like deaminating enzyme